MGNFVSRNVLLLNTDHGQNIHKGDFSGRGRYVDWRKMVMYFTTAIIAFIFIVSISVYFSKSKEERKKSKSKGMTIAFSIFLIICIVVIIVGHTQGWFNPKY
jgi:Na+/melibiose symporter-like transporter